MKSRPGSLRPPTLATALAALALVLPSAALGDAAGPGAAPPAAPAPGGCPMHAGAPCPNHGSGACPLAATASPAEKLQAVKVDPAAGAGAGKETTTLLETATFKLVRIVLRKGTVLPEHAAPPAVTIHAISGAGTLRAGPESLPLSAGTVAVLPPGLSHEVVPAAGGELVLLVTFPKKVAGTPAAPGHQHQR